MGKHALLIGNSLFTDARLSPLFAPTNDLVALQSVLKDEKISGFDTAELITNSVLETVQQAIIDFLDNRQLDDLVLLYYTGHGLLDKNGKLFFALANTSVASPAAKSLSASFLREYLDACASKRQILILDCCHSGAMLAGGKDSPVRPALAHTPLDPEGFGCFILASSESTQQSIEKGARSIFTHSLVNGLRDGKAAPFKQSISITDLAVFASAQLKAANMPMRPQFSHAPHKGATEQLIIAKNPKYFQPIEVQLVEALNDSTDPLRRRGAAAELIERAETDKTGLLKEEIVALLSARLGVEKHVDVLGVVKSALAQIEQPHSKTDDRKPESVLRGSSSHFSSMMARAISSAVLGVVIAGTAYLIYAQNNTENDPGKVDGYKRVESSLTTAIKPLISTPSVEFMLTGRGCDASDVGNQSSVDLRRFRDPGAPGKIIGLLPDWVDADKCAELLVLNPSDRAVLASADHFGVLRWDNHCLRFSRGKLTYLYTC